MSAIEHHTAPTDHATSASVPTTSDAAPATCGGRGAASPRHPWFWDLSA